MKEIIEHMPPHVVENAPDFLYVRVTFFAYLSYRLKNYWVRDIFWTYLKAVYEAFWDKIFQINLLLIISQTIF